MLITISVGNCAQYVFVFIYVPYFYVGAQNNNLYYFGFIFWFANVADSQFHFVSFTDNGRNIPKYSVVVELALK